MTTRAKAPRPTGTPAPRRRAFTIVEVLVVVVIIVALVLIAIPAFSSMLYSNNRIQAEENLKSALSLARDAAVRSAQGEDSAAVFFFEPGGQVRVVACLKVGVAEEQTNGTAPFNVTRREVFVPVEGAQPIALPKNWTVRGWATSGQVDGEWYEGADGVERYPQGLPAWVFPESDFFDRDLGDRGRDGTFRQTFMVRFEGGTGLVSTASPHAVLVVSPRPSARARSAPDDLRLDLSQDITRTVRRILADRVSPGLTTPAERQALLGVLSGDVVMAKPVPQLALVDESRLAAALGVRLDRVTGSLYRDEPFPRFVGEGAGGGGGGNNGAGTVTAERIRRWIEGDTNFNGQYGPADRADDPIAKVFVLDRFIGSAQAVALQPPQGVIP
jgi:type II secretory pathway pseudopilin PulG